VNDESRGEPAIRRIARAAAAGAIGGLAGAAVKLVCEAIAPPRTADREPPPGILVEKLVRALGGRELSKARKDRVSLAVHWTFSTVTSALYGASVERAEKPRLRNGIGFGVAVWAGFHEIALPLLGGTPPLRDLPVAEQANEFVSHVVFGVTVEAVRASVIRLIDAG
jgi:putative membrane protein